MLHRGIPARSARVATCAAAACALTLHVGLAQAAPAAPRGERAAAAVAVIEEIQQALGLPPRPGRLTPRPAGAAHPRSAAARARVAVGRMEAAGDRIAKKPYVYGGGHGSFDAAGYDCSGSLSYVLQAAKLLDAPLASGGLMTYGRPGKGRRVTIYANAGHAFMTIDGRRFDTIAFKATGSRWSRTVGSPAGYVVRHPPGL